MHFLFYGACEHRKNIKMVFLVCFVARIFEYFVLRTDQTILGEAFMQSWINTRFIERYYQSLLKRRAVINPLNKTSRNEFVLSSTIRNVHKLLRNCFAQVVKWELMEKNPCTHATVLKHKSQKRDIWTADTLMYALSVCEDE